MKLARRSALLLLVALGLLSQARIGDPLHGQGPSTALAQADGVTLTLLHNNDGESSLLPLTNPVETAGGTVELATGGIAAFKTLTGQQIAEAEAAGNAVIDVYAGDAFLASATLVCGQDPEQELYDAIAQAAIPYDVHVLGNHEFDYGPDFLQQFIAAFGGAQPFLSANLDFSGEPGLASMLDADGVIIDTPTGGDVLAKAAVISDGDAEFGIVAATTWLLPTISSPRNVELTSTDLASTAAVIQEQVDAFIADGIDKIVLVSHLQDIDNDIELVGLLEGVDIAVAGGGDELLENPDIPDAQELLPGEAAEAFGTYPLEVEDAAGDTVYIVTTAGNYKYLGRLDVVFNGEGEVTEVVTAESYPRRVVPTSAEATSLGVADAVTPDAGLVSSVVEPVEDCLSDLATTEVASTEVLLDVSRTGVRARESNAGNLVADAFSAAYDRYASDFGLPARSTSNVVIAVQNGGGIRQNAGDVLPRDGAVPGALTLLDTIDILPFGNFVTVIPEITPAEMKAIFERSAESLPGDGGQFLQVSGFSVVYDLNQPLGSRVVGIVLDDGRALLTDGQVVAGAPNVAMVTNNFTAGGGDDYQTLAAKGGKINFSITYDQALREYLDEIGSIDAESYPEGGEGRITIEQAAATPTPTQPAAIATPTQPSATATPTRNAPLPPNTGTGEAQGGSLGLALAAVALFVIGTLAVAAEAFILRGRRRED